MKIILLNGPPRAGKDTAARIILDELVLISNPVLFEKFSLPIKHAFAGLMSAGVDDYGNVEGYEDAKSNPIPLLQNSSYRDWQIAFSEDFMRKRYGTHIFSQLFLERLKLYRDNEIAWLVVVSDCGFQAEVDYIASKFPPEDLALFNIKRPGTSFVGDSRETVKPPHTSVFHSVIVNDSTIEDFRNRVLASTLNFLERRNLPDAE